MNIKRKEAAVKKFSSVALEILAGELAKAEYTPEEIAEIIPAIEAAKAGDQGNTGTQGNGNEPEAPAKPSFEEWKCQIKPQGAGKPPTVEKLKCEREAVYIQPHQAAALNDGLVYGGNNYANLYFEKGAEYPLMPE